VQSWLSADEGDAFYTEEEREQIAQRDPSQQFTQDRR
jgi:hypothetical protein